MKIVRTPRQQPSTIATFYYTALVALGWSRHPERARLLALNILFVALVGAALLFLADGAALHDVFWPGTLAHATVLARTQDGDAYYVTIAPSNAEAAAPMLFRVPQAFYQRVRPGMAASVEYAPIQGYAYQLTAGPYTSPGAGISPTAWLLGSLGAAVLDLLLLAYGLLLLVASLRDRQGARREIVGRVVSVYPPPRPAWRTRSLITPLKYVVVQSPAATPAAKPAVFRIDQRVHYTLCHPGRHIVLSVSPRLNYVWEVREVGVRQPERPVPLAHWALTALLVPYVLDHELPPSLN